MTKEIALKNGKVALVDDDDFERFSGFRWYANGRTGVESVRASCLIDGLRKKVLLHRLIMDAKPDQIVDHINCNTLDNRRSNLRFATRSQNMQNSKVRVHSSTGVRNVMPEKNGYVAIVRFENQRFRKRFKTIHEASSWATQKRIELHGAFAYDATKDARL